MHEKGGKTNTDDIAHMGDAQFVDTPLKVDDVFFVAKLPALPDKGCNLRQYGG